MADPQNAVRLTDEFRRLTHTLSTRRTQALRSHGITLAEALLIETLLTAGAVAPSALAARLGVTRGAVTRLIDRLRAKRLVVRAAAGAVDQRFQTIALTGAGARLAPSLSEAIAASDATVLAPLTQRDRDTLAHLLAKMIC